jgi:hypothetical protein
MSRAASRTMRILVLLVLCVATAGCAWIEQPSSHFTDREEALEAGMFAKGWLPEWLPASAKNLREKHNMDTNASVLRFEFNASTDEPPFGVACESTTPDRIARPRVDAWWWPDTDALLSMPKLYECRDDSGYFTIPAEGDIAYFWRIAS